MLTITSTSVLARHLVNGRAGSWHYGIVPCNSAASSAPSSAEYFLQSTLASKPIDQTYIIKYYCTVGDESKHVASIGERHSVEYEPADI